MVVHRYATLSELVDDSFFHILYYIQLCDRRAVVFWSYPYFCEENIRFIKIHLQSNGNIFILFILTGNFILNFYSKSIEHCLPITIATIGTRTSNSSSMLLVSITFYICGGCCSDLMLMRSRRRRCQCII